MQAFARQVGVTLGLGVGMAFTATSPLMGRPISTIPTPFASAHAKKKIEKVSTTNPDRNPIDSYVVAVAKPAAPHQNKLFPGAHVPAKFKPPVPTLSSGLSLEEQTAVLEETLPYGLPGVENILVRKPYVLSYNFRTKNANWVAEHHWRENMIGDAREARRDDAQFMKDQSIPTLFSQASGDYLKSGYSRGHLAPAASHSVTQDDMQQTFAFTNIIPQNQVMNETDWLHLEKFCRHLPKHFGNVRVLSGPMYIPDDRFEYTQISTPVIGSNEVHVPSHLFKVIYLQGKDVISHCHMHAHGGNGCDLNTSVLKNSIRFSYPTLVYSPHYKRMFDYITQLPDSSDIKAHLLQSFDWRTRIKHLFTVGENPMQVDDIVVMAFIMKNSNESHGKPLDTYMVKLPYVETLTGLCLTPRQDCDSITMGTWNP